MIKLELLNLKIKLEEEVLRAKLYLSQKEVVEYTSWKNANPTDRSAMDKILSQLKLEDEVWLQKEQDLISQEMALKMINLRVDVLQNTLRALGNPQSGITNEMFQIIQEEYLKDIQDMLC